MKHSLVVIPLTVVLGCSASATTYTTSHPKRFVGRWVRAHADGTWADTTIWNGNGTMSGSATRPIPSDARWSVREESNGERMTCVTVSRVRTNLRGGGRRSKREERII